MTKKLRIWHVPQVPGERMIVEVPDLASARLVLNTLAQYDLFQLEQNIKPDFANAQGLEVLDPATGEWEDWYDDETGLSFEEYCIEGYLDQPTDSE
ncbi:hypothetical protein [Spirosoma sordidisoli]|uniref:Superinfection exclusion protein n=1 Tax=Spirosoma sordidisoli TaxID=2502893 RepID=A0A4Q2UM93_9BACT|nr:hypothetical protein [Spirosoma sordidisoli]RYC70737.1 hypothetical protein EQG79_00865 [Spirosoma sordidisoli]